MYIVIYTDAALSAEDNEYNVNVLSSLCIKRISFPLPPTDLDCKEQTFLLMVEMLPG